MNDEIQNPSEGAPAPEELPHHDLMDLFQELSWHEMVRKVWHGLRAPKDSGEYKFAKLQILRLWAPFSAIAVPLLAVIALLVFSALSPERTRTYDVTILEPENLQEKLDEILKVEEPLEPPEPTDVSEMPDDAPLQDSPAPPSREEPFSPQPADFDSVAQVKSPVVMKGIYASRNPGARGSALAGYGGGHGKAAEETVYLALRWLKKYQEANGSWVTGSGGGEASQGGAAPAMTGLALLTYLAHGETPASEEFGPTIERAIKWLIANQRPDGRFNGSDGHEYSLPIAAYALCEAYALTKIPMLKDAATKAIEIIIKGQNPGLLWNYNCKTAGDRNDISYSGWCMQALKAASMAGLENPGLKECCAKAIEGCKLSYRAGGTGGGFTYARVGKSAGAASPTLTGVGVLCMQLLGAGRSAEARGGLAYLDANASCNWETPWTANPIYAWYYVTQAKFHAGGGSWKAWNNQFAPALTKSIIVIPKAIQDPKGKWVDIGYWKPAAPGGKDGKGGEHCKSYVYNTTLCALMLQVYYRYLPTYKPPEELPAETAAFQDKDKDIEIEIK